MTHVHAHAAHCLAIVTCSSNVFDDAVTVSCSGTDELPPEENTQCSVDFAPPENCKFNKLEQFSMTDIVYASQCVFFFCIE